MSLVCNNMASISCLFQILTKEFFHNELGVKYKGKEHRQRKQKQNNKRHTAQIVTWVKLKEDKIRFKCNVTAGSRSSLKTDWTAFSITVLNRLGALKLLWESKTKRKGQC